MINYANKKVLLRERKRHTARRVSSARYAGGGYPIPGLGGTPSQVWGGGYPIPGLVEGHPVPGLGITLSQVRGAPHPRSGGYPIPGLGAVPLSQVWPGGTQTWDGVPPLTWDGVPPPARPGMGYPPQCEQTDIPKYKYYLPSYAAVKMSRFYSEIHNTQISTFKLSSWHFCDTSKK